MFLLSKLINNLLPPIFLMVGSSSTLMFTFIKKVLSSTGKTFKSTYRTGFYGKSSISVGTINYWNKDKLNFRRLPLKSNSTAKTKSLLTKNYIGKY